MQTLDTLDSRALRAVDCYGQRFMREGGYAYHVLPSGGGALSQERPFKIETPLMHMTKAQTWALADELGGPDGPEQLDGSEQPSESAGSDASGVLSEPEQSGDETEEKQ